MIRTATDSDAESILEIYAPYITNTSYTFETEVPTVKSFQERINNYLQTWPWLVCEIDGIIAGYAYGSKHRERVAYQWSVECSVYIHDHFQRAGVAKALYSALIEILKLQGFRNLYAVINLPNEKSVAFHENMGFEYFAVYKNVGYKLGKWKNVGWWQLQLNEYAMEPSPPIKFSQLSKTAIEPILKSAERFLKKVQ
ncbi:MAG TPA: GNAT family N-acetyltransferase [Chitinophagaceae bacterium]|jgi:phosphinothricin acetyltransferase|nr:GNAT family N-acetyltransferase [Chitinophagaceae bacterium]